MKYLEEQVEIIYEFCINSKLSEYKKKEFLKIKLKEISNKDRN